MRKWICTINFFLKFNQYFHVFCVKCVAVRFRGNFLYFLHNRRWSYKKIPWTVGRTPPLLPWNALQVKINRCFWRVCVGGPNIFLFISFSFFFFFRLGIFLHCVDFLGDFVRVFFFLCYIARMRTIYSYLNVGVVDGVNVWEKKKKLKTADRFMPFDVQYV